MTNNAVAVETPKEKPNSLDSLLGLLNAADDGLLEIELDEHLALIEQGKIKVDSYKYLIDKLESQADMMKKYKDDYAAQEKSLRNKRKRLLDHLLFSMHKNGFDKFPGNQFEVGIRKARPSVEMKLEASAIMKAKYPDLVRTEYSWDKNKITEKLKLDDPDVRNLASFKESFYAKFNIKKGFNE